MRSSIEKMASAKMGLNNNNKKMIAKDKTLECQQMEKYIFMFVASLPKYYFYVEMFNILY